MYVITKDFSTIKKFLEGMFCRVFLQNIPPGNCLEEGDSPSDFVFQEEVEFQEYIKWLEWRAF